MVAVGTCLVIIDSLCICLFPSVRTLWYSKWPLQVCMCVCACMFVCVRVFFYFARTCLPCMCRCVFDTNTFIFSLSTGRLDMFVARARGRLGPGLHEHDSEEICVGASLGSAYAFPVLHGNLQSVPGPKKYLLQRSEHECTG